MSKDPILAEIRQIRLEIEAECQNDPQILSEYILQEQEKYRVREASPSENRLVSRHPKPAIVTSKSKQISENLAKEVV